MLTYNHHALSWLGHASFRITTSAGRIIYLDPYAVKADQPKAHLITISHEHFDHCDPAALEKLIQPNTEIVCSLRCAEQIQKKLTATQITPLKPLADTVSREVKIETIHAYNIDKFRSPNEPYHPRETGGLGFILTFDETRLYHAGDTDNIPDMEKLTGTIDIALLPVSGTYVMTAEEAAAAARVIRPRIAIPMHYGAIVGNEQNAAEFSRLLKNEPQVAVEVLKRET